MKRRHRIALAFPAAALAACSAPAPQAALTTGAQPTTTTTAEPTTTVADQLAALAPVVPTPPVGEPGPVTTTTAPANSIANGPLPVDVSDSGTATWYDPPWEGYTAASRDYPRGARLQVCHRHRAACVVVTVDDYGPAAWTGHALDLSWEAFEALAPLSAGVIPVTWTEVA